MRSWNVLMSALLLLLAYLAFSPPAKSAHVVVFAAAAPAVAARREEYAGAFLAPSTKIARVPNRDAESEELARELWATTEGILTEIGVWADVV